MQTIFETLTAIFIFYYIITFLITLGVKIEYESDYKTKNHNPITIKDLLFAPIVLPIIIGMILGEKDKKSKELEE